MRATRRGSPAALARVPAAAGPLPWLVYPVRRTGHAVAAMKTAAPVVAALALVLLGTASASPSTAYWAYDCAGGNYTVPSKYQQNFEELSAALPKAVSSSPYLFDNKVVGSSSKIYALAHCRADTEASACKRCLTQAFEDARVVCAFRKSVYIYYKLCTLAFAEEDILSHSRGYQGLIKGVSKGDGPQVPAQCKVFKTAASELIISLAMKAADAPKRFATGQKDLNEDDCEYRLYGLAECLPEMSAAKCRICLEDLTSATSPIEQEGEWSSALWCSYRFELYPFFHVDKGNKIVWIVVGVVVGVVIITLSLIFLLWWTLSARRPSAIDCFDEITASVQGKTIALFLDYDGTLTPIVDKPEKAVMSDEMRDAVREAALSFPTSVVTGRSCDKVKEFIRLDQLHYAGSHGMDIQLSDEAEPFQPTSEYGPTITQATECLEKVVKEIKGATVENNKFCVSVHYRNVHKKERKLVKDLVKRTLIDFSDLEVTHGKMVLEVRPKADFNKGHAVKYLLEYLVNKNNWDSSQVLAIYIGDDRTDEDAFKVFCEQDGGFGILVSKKRRRTKAFYSLKDPRQVKEFLQKLVSWNNGEAQV